MFCRCVDVIFEQNSVVVHRSQIQASKVTHYCVVHLFSAKSFFMVEFVSNGPGPPIC